MVDARDGKEQEHISGVHVTLRTAARSGCLWALSALYFCIVMAFYGVSFWLPQIVQATGGLSSATVRR